ncbi:MAG TPA: hypothetical protein VED40_19325 [Azospirillaceae bacterium]|nr:hypothetical protein [Azospirillaceae bacterium]
MLERAFTASWHADVRDCYLIGLTRWSQTVADEYDALIRRAVEDVVSDPTGLLNRHRPDLGAEDVRIRPLSASRHSGSLIIKPAHFVVFRYLEGDTLVRFVRLVRGAALVPHLISEAK